MSDPLNAVDDARDIRELMEPWPDGTPAFEPVKAPFPWFGLTMRRFRGILNVKGVCR